MPELTPAEEFIYKWQHGQLGGFKTALLHAIQEADIHNLDRLRLSFPDEVEGYVCYRHTSGWWDALEARMNGRAA